METKYAKIRPRRDTAANLKSANPILLAGELCYEFETVVGKGSAKQKMGDGSTAYNQLQYIANDDVTNKVVSSFDTVTDQNPVLGAGKSIKYYLGAIKKKFDYYLSLINSKIGTDKIYSGLDSSNSTQVLAATAGKQLKELCDKNTKGVSDLNSNLGAKQDSLKLSVDTPIDYPASSGGSSAAQNGGWVADSNAAYYNLMMGWALLQLKMNNRQLAARICWGNSAPSDWVEFASKADLDSKIDTLGAESDAIKYMKYAWVNDHYALVVHFKDGKEKYLYFDA